jgi:hypothetical protein
MKQKYLILKDNDKKELIIREFAELDKEVLSPLCEEIYDAKVIQAAIKEGKETLIQVLRTKNMYPPDIYANQIAHAVLSIFAAKESESLELFFDDIELINRDEEDTATLADLESESEEIDDELLQDDYEENFDDKGTLKQINSPLQIADDESVDKDNDN